MVEVWCCYFGDVLFRGQPLVQVNTQVALDGWQHDGFWSNIHRAITTFCLGKVSMGSKPDWLSLVLLFTFSCCRWDARQAVMSAIQLDRRVHTASTSWDWQLACSCTLSAFRCDSVSCLISDVLRIGSKFRWTQDRSLRNAAVNWKAWCLLTSLDERLCSITYVGLESAESRVDHRVATGQD